MSDPLVRNVHGKSFGSNFVGKKIKDTVQRTRELVNTLKLRIVGNTPRLRRLADSTFGKRAFKVLGKDDKFGSTFIPIGFGIWNNLRGAEKLTGGNIGDTILLEAAQNSMRLQDVINVYTEATGKYTDNNL